MSKMTRNTKVIRKKYVKFAMRHSSKEQAKIFTSTQNMNFSMFSVVLHFP